jgi:hypothetical protein
MYDAQGKRTDETSSHEIETRATMLQRRSITRELETLKQFAGVPEQVDERVLAAIHTSLNLEDERIAAPLKFRKSASILS